MGKHGDSMEKISGKLDGAAMTSNGTLISSIIA
jgi:hypothetical protein